MDDILPDVWITADVDGATFLDRIQHIADTTGNFESQSSPALGFGIGRYLYLYPSGSFPHVKLLAQLITYEHQGRRIRVEMRAHRWNPDPPTYEVYVEAAIELINPLLRAYNRAFQSRRRLGIQAKLATEPVLPAAVKPYFDSFVNCANMGMLHPNDWDRFYRFIRVCHKKQVGLTEVDIGRLLSKAGFDDEYARRIGSVYDHGRRLLRM